MPHIEVVPQGEHDRIKQTGGAYFVCLYRL